MPMFVHLAPESRLPAIRRNGIGRPRGGDWRRPGGIFAMPVVRDFFVAHQWPRELKRGGQGPLAGVYFRIPDDETVWVGHFGQEHLPMTAARAVAEFEGPEDRMGWEVVIPRKVSAKEIRRVRSLSQVIGWRYFPTSKGKPPSCTCKYCTRGLYGAARLRARLDRWLSMRRTTP